MNQPTKPEGIKAIATGWSHLLLTTTTDKLLARGFNSNGQLGILGIRTDQVHPIQLHPGKVKAIAAGNIFSLFATEDGRLFGMGENDKGQLGINNPADQHQPIQINTHAKVIAVAAHGSHSFYITDDGKLFGMGANHSGQLGTGDTTNRTTPVQIATNVVAVATNGAHTLYITNDGKLFGMGLNIDGTLGLDTLKTCSTPTQIDTNGAKVIAIATGGHHSCYLTDNAKLFAMGNNFEGQLGTGDTTPRTKPVQIAANVAAIAAGNYITTYLTTQGKLMAAGFNYYNQIIDDDNIRNCPVPTQIDTQNAKVTTIAINEHFINYGTTDGKLVINDEDETYKQFDINENVQKTPAEKPQSLSPLEDLPEDPTMETPETEPTMSI